MRHVRRVFGAALLLSGAAHATEFKPNGSVGLNQTFYGNAGSYETATSHPSLSMSYQFSPKWSLDIEWDRTWNLYSYDGGSKQQNNDYSQPAATANYDYGRLGSSNVIWSSSIKIENQTSFNGNSQAYVMAQTVF